MRAYAAVAKTRIPFFIQEDYPDLANFLAAYYDWFTQEFIDKTDFLGLSDIDKTTEDFVQYFKENHAKGLPDEIESNLRETLKHIRELYKSKGTEGAIKFLFRAVFNEHIDIFYPRTQMLHASDATWVRQRTVVIQNNGKPAGYFDQKEMSIPFGQLYVESSITNGAITKLFVTDVVGNVENVSVLKLGEDSFSIVKQVTKVKVNSPGEDFVVGQLLSLDNGVIVRVKELTRGPITHIDIISPGEGYLGGELVQFFENGPLGKTSGVGAVAAITQTAGEITGVTVLNGGSFYDLPPEVFCQPTIGVIAGSLRARGNFSGIKSVEIIDGGTDLPPNPWTQSVLTANVTVEFGNVAENPGYFANQNGALSSKNAFLEDEHYYQYYSYVIKSGVNTSLYEKILRLFAHPAGMIFFGSLLLEERVFAGSGMISTNNFFVIDETFAVAVYSLNESTTIVNLYSALTHVGTQRYEVDINKYIWLSQSTYIDRFKNETIGDWLSESTLNPLYNKGTNVQPDCQVGLQVTVTSEAKGFGMGGYGLNQLG